MRPMNIILSAGGTGGHIFPAIAVAEEIRNRFKDSSILFVGAHGKMEMQKVPKAGFEIEGLPVHGLTRRMGFKSIVALWKFGLSVFGAMKIMRRFKPDVVMGFGAFASAPILCAAIIKKVHIVLHEQNAYPGLVNRWIGKYADRICVAFEDMHTYFPSNKIIYTGNPIRLSIDNELSREEAKIELGLDPNKKLVLITGGSLGAKTLNDAMLNALNKIRDAEQVQWLWQCGDRYFENLTTLFKDLPAHVQLVPFINRMQIAMIASDLICARAGALTLSEIAGYGRASILIPSPNVAEDHQNKNARAVEMSGGALVLQDSDAKDHLIDRTLELIQDDERLDLLERKSKERAVEHATEHIVDIIDEIVNS